MTTLLWLVPLLVFTLLAGYAWGTTRLFPYLWRDFTLDMLKGGLIDILHSHPWYRRGAFGRAVTRIFFGTPLAILGAVIVVVFFLFATVLLIARLVRERFRIAPQPPRDPTAPASAGVILRRLLRQREPEIEEPAKPKLVKRASVVSV